MKSRGVTYRAGGTGRADYALWDIIENDKSFKPVAETTTYDAGTSTIIIPGLVTIEEKAKKKNDVKARSMLLMALLNKHLMTFNQYKDAKTLFAAIEIIFDLEKIHENDVEEIDLKWQLALLSMRAKRFFQKTGKKITINGRDIAGYDKSKVEWFNCHKLGHFARECKSYMVNDEAPTNMAFIALSDSENIDAPLIEDWESNDEDEVESPPEKERKNVEPSIDKVEVEIPKQNDKPAWRPIKYAEIYRTQRPRARCKYHQRERMVNGTNHSRVNHNATTIPKAMLTRTGLKHVNSVRLVNPKRNFFKKINTAKEKVNTARPNSVVLNAVRANKGKAVKASTCHSHKKIEDQGYFNNGCSWHMTGNISYLINFKEFYEGYVAFEGGAKGGKITGKGTIRTADESHVLLKVPRKNNMYSVDMKNIVPKKDLTCLVAKATNDESMHWHRRLDLFSPTSVSSIMPKKYSHVITDDFSNFTWVFFLVTKDEISRILKSFITKIENLLDKKIKIIICDNGTKFKNRVMNEFSKEKGIKKEYSVARSPQQNGVAERKNKTLIKAARTMLADSKLPITFWAEAVNTACYVHNRVLVVKPHFKTPYELFRGRTLALNEEFFFGYSTNSKAFRVYNTRTRKVEENLHIMFFENKPLIVGKEASFDAGQSSMEEGPNQDYILMPLWNDDSLFDSFPKDSDSENSDTDGSINIIRLNDDYFGANNDMRSLNGVELDISNLSTTYHVLMTPNTRINKDHSFDNVIGDMQSGAQTRRMTVTTDEQGFISAIYEEKTYVDLHTCLFAYFLSQDKPKRITNALKDPAWVEVIQEELMQFHLQKMDVKSAFLYGRIEEEVYVCQPPGFEDPDYTDKVYKVEKALFEVKNNLHIECNDKGVNFIEARINQSLKEFLHQPHDEKVRELVSNSPRVDEEVKHMFDHTSETIDTTKENNVKGGFNINSGAVSGHLCGKDVSNDNPTKCDSPAIGVIRLIFSHDSDGNHGDNGSSDIEEVIIEKVAPDVDISQSKPVVIVSDTEKILDLTFEKVNTFNYGGIGLSMSATHKIFDGHTYFLFMKAWAAAARGSPERMSQSFVASQVFPNDPSFKYSWPSKFTNTESIITNYCHFLLESQPDLPMLMGEIRESIAKINSDHIESIKGENGQKEFNQILRSLKDLTNVTEDGDNCLFVTSILHSGMYELDFGWGKPIWYCDMNAGFSRIVALNDTLKAGSAEATVTLKCDEMEIFEHDHELLSYVMVDPTSSPSMSSLQLEVRNLSETHKKKVDVYFSKAESDGIFDILMTAVSIIYQKEKSKECEKDWKENTVTNYTICYYCGILTTDITKNQKRKRTSEKDFSNNEVKLLKEPLKEKTEQVQQMIRDQAKEYHENKTAMQKKEELWQSKESLLIRVLTDVLKIIEQLKTKQIRLEEHKDEEIRELKSQLQKEKEKRTQDQKEFPPLKSSQIARPSIETEVHYSGNTTASPKVRKITNQLYNVKVDFDIPDCPTFRTTAIINISMVHKQKSHSRRGTGAPNSYRFL
uniref:Integrase catalytic domain-containing protein n=1 Tax=Tanacetum cinerariifolium TaxID=118510 RepID=A0A6L2MFW5_TANCI|nr:hypothetical protein [Tanacetum cinerariifolium]